MIGAAGVLYAWFASERPRHNGLRLARAFYGLGLIPFGVAHFAYLKETVVLIPHWLPWPPAAWAYFTGATFIAAGVAAIVRVWARLAVVLSVLQIALFTLVIWVPMIITGHPTPFQWMEFISSCALTAAGWVVADSYRGIGWLAVGDEGR
jgi:uncharacterized membrane protein